MEPGVHTCLGGVPAWLSMCSWSPQDSKTWRNSKRNKELVWPNFLSGSEGAVEEEKKLSEERTALGWIVGLWICLPILKRSPLDQRVASEKCLTHRLEFSLLEGKGFVFLPKCYFPKNLGQCVVCGRCSNHLLIECSTTAYHNTQGAVKRKEVLLGT